MKKLIAAAILASGMTGIAAADEAKAPTMMTEAEMDEIVGGFFSLPSWKTFSILDIYKLRFQSASGLTQQTATTTELTLYE